MNSKKASGCWFASLFWKESHGEIDLDPFQKILGPSLCKFLLFTCVTRMLIRFRNKKSSRILSDKVHLKFLSQNHKTSTSEIFHKYDEKLSYLVAEYCKLRS